MIFMKNKDMCRDDGFSMVGFGARSSEYITLSRRAGGLLLN